MKPTSPTYSARTTTTKEDSVSTSWFRCVVDGVANVFYRRRASRDIDRLLEELPRHITRPLRPDLPTDWKLQLLRRVEPVTIPSDDLIVFANDVTDAAARAGFLA